MRKRILAVAMAAIMAVSSVQFSVSAAEVSADEPVTEETTEDTDVDVREETTESTDVDVREEATESTDVDVREEATESTDVDVREETTESTDVDIQGVTIEGEDANEQEVYFIKDYLDKAIEIKLDDTDVEYTTNSDNKMTLTVPYSTADENGSPYTIYENEKGKLYKFSVPANKTLYFRFVSKARGVDILSEKNIESLTSVEDINGYDDYHDYSERYGGQEEEDYICFGHTLENEADTEAVYYMWIKGENSNVKIKFSTEDMPEEGTEDTYENISTIAENADCIQIGDTYTVSSLSEKMYESNTDSRCIGDIDGKSYSYGKLLKFSVPAYETAKINVSTTESHEEYDLNAYLYDEEFELQNTWEVGVGTSKTYELFNDTDKTFYLWINTTHVGGIVDVSVKTSYYKWYKDDPNINELVDSANEITLGEEEGYKTKVNGEKSYVYELYRDYEVEDESYRYTSSYGELVKFTLPKSKNVKLYAYESLNEDGSLTVGSVEIYKSGEDGLIPCASVTVSSNSDMCISQYITNDSDEDETYYAWIASVNSGEVSEVTLKSEYYLLPKDTFSSAQIISQTTEVDYLMYKNGQKDDHIVNCSVYADAEAQDYQLIKLEGPSTYKVEMVCDKYDRNIWMSGFDSEGESSTSIKLGEEFGKETVVTVDEGGLYLFIGSSYNNDGSEDNPNISFKVTRVDNPVKVESIEIILPTYYKNTEKPYIPGTMEIYGWAQLDVKVEPEDATDKGIIWTSSDEEKLRVDEETCLNAYADWSNLEKGEVTITATAADGSGVSTSITVKMIDYTEDDWIQANTKVGDTYYYVLNMDESDKTVDLYAKLTDKGLFGSNMGFEDVYNPDADGKAYAENVEGGTICGTWDTSTYTMTSLTLTPTADVVYYNYYDTYWTQYKMAFVISKETDTEPEIESSSVDTDEDIVNSKIGYLGDEVTATETVTEKIAVTDASGDEVGGDTKKVTEKTVTTALTMKEGSSEEGSKESTIKLVETVDADSDSVTSASVNVSQEKMSEAALKYALGLVDSKNNEYRDAAGANSSGVVIDKVSVTYTDDGTADDKDAADDKAPVISQAVFNKLNSLNTEASEDSAEKKVTLNVVKLDNDNKEEYSWSFDSSKLTYDDLDKIEQSGLNTKLEVREPEGNDAGESEKTKLEKVVSIEEEAATQIVEFAHSGTVPGAAKVRIKAGEGYKEGDDVYFYYLKTDGSNFKLAEPQTVKVDKDGFIEVKISHCSNYVMTKEKASLPLEGLKIDTSNATKISDDEAAAVKLILDASEGYTPVVTPVPEDTTDKYTITWDSSDKDVATVDEKGTVTGVAVGTATITATIKKDDTTTLTASYKVSVVNDTLVTDIALKQVNTDNEETDAEAVTIDGVGKAKQLKAVITPDTAAIKTVTWSSSDEKVAAVDENGKVKAVSEGTATITAKANDGSGKSASCTVTVSKGKVYVTKLVLNTKTLELKEEETAELSVSVTPKNADKKTVTWKTTNDKVATVDAYGKVTAVKGGSAIDNGKVYIYAIADDGSKVEAGCVVTVTKADEEPEVTVTGVTLDSSATLTLEKGKTATRKATVTYSNGTTDNKVTWSSDNEAVAKVSDSGVVTAVSKGTANIKATAGEKSVSFVVSVTEPAPTPVKVSGVTLGKTSLSLIKGRTETISVSVTPSNAANKGVTWKSSNTKVATVDTSGKVTAVAEGSATITATAADGSGKSASCKVTVTAPAAAVTTPTPVKVSGVTLGKTSVSLVKGHTETIGVSVSPSNAANKGITWKSSNTGVATVDASGKVTAVAEGSATITATAADGSGKSAGCKVTVTVPSVTVSYKTHIQKKGWESEWKTNGQMSGTSNESKRLEGIYVKVSGNSNLGIQYTTHCQSYGWLPWSANGDLSGTSGESKRLEAIKIQLTGADKDLYDVYYRVHAQTYGWLGWAKNGAAAGTAGQSKRLEAIQIVVVKKGESFDTGINGIKSVWSSAYVAVSGSTTDVSGADTPNVTYRTHVQTYGWQGWKYNGQMSGTSGESKRLEGIEIKLTNCPYSGGITYQTHIQTYGWSKGWSSDGKMAGTSGESKRLEAIQIKLTGEMANHYDVYYRVHAQSYGWLGWAKNGESAGTSGLSKRLEGIQIVLVPKGSSAPSVNYGGVKSVNASAYVKK